MLAAVLVLGPAVGGCGDDDSGPADADTGLVTVVALDLELPFAVPGDIPAPSDGELAGENEAASPYRAVQIGTSFDAEQLREEVRAFGRSVSARYDEGTGQVVYETDLDGVRHTVYVWVRTDDGGDHPTLLEVGILENEPS